MTCLYIVKLIYKIILLKMKTGVFESMLYKIITKNDFLFRLLSL